MTNSRLPSEWFAAAARVLDSEISDLRALAELAGADSKTFYRGSNLRGADLRGQDLRGMDFTGADFSGALIDQHTQMGNSINLVLLGGPGSGKSTQVIRLAKKRNMTPFMTGDLLRSIRRDGTGLGAEIDGVISAGELISDDLLMRLISYKIESVADQVGIVFDGFPRTLQQSKILDEILISHCRTISHVFEITVGDSQAADRVSGRFTCTNCKQIYSEYSERPGNPGKCDTCGGQEFKRRADDNFETVRTRSAEFRMKSPPLIEKYRSMGLLTRIDGTLTVDQVTTQILSVVRKIEKNQGELTEVLCPVGR